MIGERTNVKHINTFMLCSVKLSEFWLTTMSLYWLGQTLQQFTLFVIIHVDELFVFCLFFHLFRWFEVCCRGAWTGEKPTTGADFDPWETMWRSRGPSATSGSHWITTGTPKLFGLHVLGTIIILYVSAITLLANWPFTKPAFSVTAAVNHAERNYWIEIP